MELILKHKSDIPKAQTVLFNISDELTTKPYRLEIKPYKAKRSLDANAYFHALVGKIAEAVKCGAEETKVRLNLDYGTPASENGEQIIVALPKKAKVSDYYHYAKWIGDFNAKNNKEYSQYLFYKQTHMLDSKEMARLIDGVIEEAKNLNIETKTPEEIAKMKSLWGQYEKSKK